MKKTPCEYLLWHGLPVIRKEIAECMINKHGLSQKEAAEKLGVTPAAISQYLHKKRAISTLIDDEIRGEIHISVLRIIKYQETAVIPETCRICKIIQQKNHALLFHICKKKSKISLE